MVCVLPNPGIFRADGPGVFAVAWVIASQNAQINVAQELCVIGGRFFLMFCSRDEFGNRLGPGGVFEESGRHLGTFFFILVGTGVVDGIVKPDREFHCDGIPRLAFSCEQLVWTVTEVVQIVISKAVSGIAIDDFPPPRRYRPVRLFDIKGPIVGRERSRAFFAKISPRYPW